MSLSFEHYQNAARKTANYPGRLEEGPYSGGIVYTTLGLAGEAGEYADKIKKVIRDDEGIVTEDRKAALAAELGDVLWYLAMACDELGLKMEDVALYNIRKLADRSERGVIGGEGDKR